MIFRRKKNAVTEDPSLDNVTAGEDAADAETDQAETDDAGSDEAGSDKAGSDEAGSDKAGSDKAGSDKAGSDKAGSDKAGSDKAGSDKAGSGEAGSDKAGSGDEVDVEALDAGEWRSDGPYDISEVESDDEVDELESESETGSSEQERGARLDLGSMILTGIEEMELRLQMAEETQQIVSAMMIKDDSALEVAAYAAPRSGGLWAELREEMMEQTTEAGGSHSLVAGPFGVELRRMLPVAMANGDQGFQPSRMWVVEGQRWLLRGIVYGRAALGDSDDTPMEDLAAAFRGVIVRRGNEAKAPGDLLSLSIPEDLVRAQEEADQ